MGLCGGSPTMTYESISRGTFEWAMTDRQLFPAEISCSANSNRESVIWQPPDSTWWFDIDTWFESEQNRRRREISCDVKVIGKMLIYHAVSVAIILSGPARLSANHHYFFLLLIFYLHIYIIFPWSLDPDWFRFEVLEEFFS